MPPGRPAKGCKVIDCSGAFFADADVPMIVAGVNDCPDPSAAPKMFVGVPSAAVASMILLPLKAADQAYGIQTG